ncbi:beta-1,3-glucan-binding protein-like [Cydia amplana]|uniref:beta-1,3-glucan-binding protein-like n=1 Tax=Cydia amplana TaxID=1869771 RepID=UPI002FE61082
MAVKELCCVFVALFCAGARADTSSYSVPEPTIQVFQPKGFRATIPDATNVVYFLIQGQLIKKDTSTKQDFHGGETGSPVEINGQRFWVVDLPEVQLEKGDKIEYLAFVAIKSDGYIRDNLEYTVDDFATFTPLPERVVYPQYPEVDGTTTKACEPSATRLQKGGTVCKGQVVFEEKFDTLNKDVWQVEHYIPTEHPEVPFVSYQASAVSVQNGELHITTSEQFNETASLYTNLDLGIGCTSGESDQCSVDQTEQSGRAVPPVISGRITSKLGFAFKYGTVSVRAKFPKGDWIYPEILLEPFLKKFGINSRNTGILKIVSARGNANLNKKLYGGPVLDSRCHDALLVTKPESETAWSNDFHVYSAKWTPESLVLSVDGEVYATVEPAANGLRGKLPETCSGVQANGIAPFNEFFYLTLGVAVGGDAEFHDSNDSSAPKPWRNGQVNAASNFWKDHSWKATWTQPELVVDFVKVEAL